jgi:hypothetical protein
MLEFASKAQFDEAVTNLGATIPDGVSTGYLGE